MPYIIQLLFYIGVYFIAGRFGFFLNGLSSENFLFFWPPAGISLAVLLLYGYRFLPGIFIGAVLVSLSTGTQLPLSLMIGLGSTLTPLVSAFILKRLIPFQNFLERTRDITGLTLIAIPVGSAVLATSQAAYFWLSKLTSTASLSFIWTSIWLSNVLSEIVICTFILVWFANPYINKVSSKRFIEGLLLSTSVVLLGALMFTNFVDKTISLSYFMFIPLVWAALRFGLRETASVIFAFTMLSIWSTLLGYGPFSVPSFSSALLYLNLGVELLYLQGFMTVVSITSMILATTVAERKELEQRKDNFITMASHELKTPLTSIKIVMQLLQKMDKDEREKNEGIYLNNVDQQVNKLTYLINEMLDLSKIQVGQLSLKKQSFSFAYLVKQTVQSIQTTTSHKIIVKGKVSKKVFLDKERIGQVLINLLSNAIKYSPAEKEIILRISSNKEFLTVCVKDYGIGIPKDKRKQIFERFYRIHESGEKTYSGFGLGLYISSEIIKQHKGKIWVESKEGKGSSFYFELPLV